MVEVLAVAGMTPSNEKLLINQEDLSYSDLVKEDLSSG